MTKRNIRYTTALLIAVLLTAGCVLTGCMQTTAEYKGMKFATTRVLYDTGLESALVELDPATKTVKIDIQGYQSEGSKALELAKAAVQLAAEQRNREPETAAVDDEADSPPSLFEDPEADEEPAATDAADTEDPDDEANDTE